MRALDVLRKISPVRLTWGQAGGLPECPYFRRWILDFGIFALRVHRWYADDDHRAFHDHPYWFVTIVLWGGYVDVSGPETGEGPPSEDRLGIGSIRFRPAHFRHSVQQVRPGTATILISGRPSRRWGFWVDGKLIRRDKYFAVHGHHPCDPAGAPVRMKPDGTRIEQ